jgi:hypothetical protein
MTYFQWLFGAFCAYQLCRAAFLFRRSRGLANFLSTVVWLAALVLLLKPELSTNIAQPVGVQRGADFVLYVLAILFLVVHWQHFARYKRLEGHVTTLVRELAMARAKRPLRRRAPHPRRSRKSSRRLLVPSGGGDVLP